MSEEEQILVDNLLTLLPYGLAGSIYRSPLPFSPLFDRQGLVLDAFVSAGVDTVVMLTPKSEVKDLTALDPDETVTEKDLITLLADRAGSKEGDLLADLLRGDSPKILWG